MESKFYRKDTFIWLPNRRPAETLHIQSLGSELAPRAVRAYYYASVQGDDEKLAGVKEELWSIGFQPEVFKKPAGERRSKGVDIALAKDVLSNAFMQNYESALLIAGDGDYVPLVNEVERLGKRGYVLFSSSFSSTAAPATDRDSRSRPRAPRRRARLPAA